MRFLMLVKSTTCDQGAPADEGFLTAMDKYNEDLMKAGALVELSGLHPTSAGARVKLSNGLVTVTDGPFPETKELLGGFWMIDVNSKEEAVAWATRAPMPPSRQVEIEVRRIYDVGEFVPRRAVEKARGEGKKQAAGKI